MDGLLGYIPIAMMMVVMPGADTILLVRNTLSHGTKAGRYSTLGMATGLLFWTLIAMLGLAVVIAKSVVLFNVIKYLGAAYLIFLGIKSLFSKSFFSMDTVNETAGDESKKGSAHKESYRQGMLSNIFNPKTVLLYVTIMPQFLDLGGNVNEQLIILGLILTGLAVGWFFLLVFIMDHAKRWLNNTRFQNIFQKSAGALLVGFGIKTAL